MASIQIADMRKAHGTTQLDASDLNAEIVVIEPIAPETSSSCAASGRARPASSASASTTSQSAKRLS